MYAACSAPEGSSVCDDEYAEFWRKLQLRFQQRPRPPLRPPPPPLPPRQGRRRAELEELGPSRPEVGQLLIRTCIGPNECNRRFKTTNPYKRLCEGCSKIVRDAPFITSW